MSPPKHRTESLLHLNDDVLLMICELADRYDHQCRTKREARPSHHLRSMLVSICTTCRHLRDIGTPILYSKAAILNNRRDSAGQPWPADIASILRTIEQAALFRRYCQSLTVDIDCEQSRDLSETLAATVSKLPKLRQLELSLSVWMREHVTDTFGSAQMNLVNVEKLSIHTVFAPNIIIHDTLHTLRVFDSTPNAEHTIDSMQTLLKVPLINLRTLDARAWWSPELMQHLSNMLPQLERLGTLSDNSVEALLPSLSGFQSLKVLTTSGLDDLWTRYNPPRCGNAYFGREGEALERELAQVKEEVLQELSEGAFNACPQLESLWVYGEGKALCERADNGKAQSIHWVDAAVPDLFS